MVGKEGSRVRRVANPNSTQVSEQSETNLSVELRIPACRPRAMKAGRPPFCGGITPRDIISEGSPERLPAGARRGRAESRGTPRGNLQKELCSRHDQAAGFFSAICSGKGAKPLNF